MHRRKLTPHPTTIPASIAVDEAGKARRTAVLLARFHGHEKEWSILHGVLCASHIDADDALTAEDQTMVRHVYDSMKIAERMDAINRAVLEAYRAERAREAA